MVEYFPLLAIVVLITAAIVLVTLRLVRPIFAYSWLIAAFGALIAWPLVLLSRSIMPDSISLFVWQPDWLFPYSPNLLIDQYSWPYAFALATVVLSVILTDVVRANEADWSVWAGSLVLGALGILAVQAGNPLTLLIIWTAIDLAEVLILLGQASQRKELERAIAAFSARLAGSLLLVWAMIYASYLGENLLFSQIPSQASIYLLLAAALRLGVLPFHQPYLQEVPLRRSLGTISRLVSAAASMILLTRTAIPGVPEFLSPTILVLTGITAIYAALAWASAQNELDGRPYWILGMAAISIASTVTAQPYASLAWGVLTILSGGVLFLVSARHRYLVIILMLGMIGLTTLPFTSAWNGALLYTPPFRLSLILFLIAQSLFMGGYLRHSLRKEKPLSGTERWVWVIYPWGLVLLPFSQFLIGWLGYNIELNLSTLLPGVIVCLLSGVWIALYRQLIKRPTVIHYAQGIAKPIERIFSLNWMYLLIWRAYLIIGRLVSFVIVIFEGDGGVLWAIFFLVILLAIIAQLRIGV